MSPAIATVTIPYAATPNELHQKVSSHDAPQGNAENDPSPIEAQVARERARIRSRRYFDMMYERAMSDVVIIGAGCAGLSCAFHLAKTRPDLKITILEANVAPGGGAWLGGQPMTPMVVSKLAYRLLTELDVPFEVEGNFVVVKHAALFTSTILSKVLRMPNVVMFNATTVEDLMVHDDRITGVATNWAPVAQNHDSQSCMGPNVITAPVTVSATGHDGQIGAFCAKRLVSAGLREQPEGMRRLDTNKAESMIIRGTCEVAPGLIIAGMELCYGYNSMGQTFGEIMFSGISAAIEAIRVLDTHRSNEQKKKG
ncbi:Thi4-domain-containing protein [Lactarius pseudohatsudake]|nr:Thi4-domain-containing protein [Lactarius pseudohatsudake]